VSQKITLLDGGMGQELLSRSTRPITSLWSADIMLNEPELVRDLHSDFIKSGARVITLNTYTATPERLIRENEMANIGKLHQSAMRAALDARDNAMCDGVRIAGCLPPLVASYRPEVSLSFDQALPSYQRLVALQEPASDLFICETMATIAEASAACHAARDAGKPIWVAFTVSDTDAGALRSGESVQDAVNAVQQYKPEAILLNCSQPEAVDASWRGLSLATQAIGAYANGFKSVSDLHPGGTVENMETREDLGPSRYAKHALNWIKNGASIVGGCCEIGPKHIAYLHQALLAQGYELS
jgi:S-methylmethionine-dependent homocysteine/selenocysteine methylase